ncbi:MAG: preprotein translocase subunit SecG [Spirochaetaceae bacterium]|nr:MAG: preprotein translocase subunit SecG [Spirochaetaceae bacterium]
MGFLGILLLIVFILSAALLAAMVLLQDESGDGLGGIFGGGGGSQQIGNRRGNILTRTTSILGTVFLVSSLGLAFVNRTPSTGDVESAARRMEAEGQVYEWWTSSQDQNAVEAGAEIMPESALDGADQE